MSTATVVEKPKDSIDDSNSKPYDILGIFGRVKPGYDHESVLLSLLDTVESNSEKEGKWEVWSSHQGRKKHYTQFMSGHSYESIKSHWHYDYNIFLAQKHKDKESRFFLDDANRVAIMNDGNVKEIWKANIAKNDGQMFEDTDLTDIQRCLTCDRHCKFAIGGKHHEDGSSSLWINLNGFIKIYLTDLTESVGQIIITGNLKNLRENKLNELYKVDPKQKIIEFPYGYIWKLRFSPDGKFSFKKWKINYHEVDAEKVEATNRFYVPSVILP